MIACWHYLSDDDPLPPLGASTFLDVAGATVGMRSPLRLVRPYFKGREDPALFASKARSWHANGAAVKAGNEPNHPLEGFGGGPADYLAWYLAVRTLCPGVRLYWAGMSPGFEGWQNWYDGAQNADGIAAHAYGTFEQMRAIVAYLVNRFPSTPIWVAECNFGPGAGVTVDRNQWAREYLRPFLDWCAGRPQIEAVSYFAYRWPTPDMPMGTPVDGAGTEIETIIRGWRAPVQPPPMEGTLTATEQAEFLASLWNQTKFPLNPGSAFYVYWAKEAREGRYMGLPTSAEFRTKDGKWGLQMFVAGIIHAQVGVWKVSRGLPPLA